MNKDTRLYTKYLWPLLVFMLLLAAYTSTLMPGPVGGDAGELQYAGPLLALPHPTGFPLYVILGHLWSNVVVIGSIAYRMNLLAAASGALGGASVTWLAYRLHGRSVIAVAAGLILGLGATYWGQSVLADKYALNGTLAALIVGLTLLWAQEHDRPQGNRLLYTLSLAYGISLLHHRMMLLFAPGIAFLVLYHERWAIWRNRRRTAICLALVIGIPLLIYPTVLPLVQSRELSPSEWQPQTLQEWIDWLTDTEGASGAFVASGVWDKFQDYLQSTIQDYTVVVVGIAVFGLGAMLWREPASAIFWLTSYVLQAGPAANWRANDRPFTYFLPSFALMIFAFTYGAYVLWEMLNARLARPEHQRLVGPGFAVVALAVIILQFSYAFPLRYDDATYGESLDLWRTDLKTGNMGERLASGMPALPPRAVLFSDWEQATVLWYYQQVEDVRPDLEIIYPIDRGFDDYATTDRDLCVARHIPVDDRWHPTAYNALVCLQRQPAVVDDTTAIPMNHIGTTLFAPTGEPVLELAGYQADPTPYEAGRYVPLVLVWHAQTDPAHDYSISLVIMQDWQPYWKRDIQHPVSGMYPTSRWAENELVRDYHELDLPPDMPPGDYFWTVVVYRQLDDGSFEKLVDVDGGDHTFGASFRVE